MHFRSRRSIDKDDEDVRMDANLLSRVSQLIVRREVGNKDKEHHKKEKGVSVIKRKDKKVNGGPVNKRHDHNEKRKDSHHLLKKQGLEIQADKHHAKPADKHKTKADELSKANLVKALIEGDSGAKGGAGVPEKEYRELVEFIASSDQPTIETSSKKSDITRPSPITKGGHKKLTKKHKRVLAILAKMAPNVLRKYFHRKGLDKYWKVMNSIRKMNAAKQSKKERLKVHKDVKSFKQVRVVTEKKLKPSSGIKHPEKDALLKKNVKALKKVAKKEVSLHKIVKDTLSQKSQKPKVTKSYSKQKVIIVKPAEEKRADKLNTAKDQPFHHDTKEGQKTTMEQHPKEISHSHKDEKRNLTKEKKKKDVVKEEKEEKTIASLKSSEAPDVVLSQAKDSVANKTDEKPKTRKVKDVTKQEPRKKVLTTVSVKETAPPKNLKDKAKDGDTSLKTSKALKVNTSHVKIPASSIQPAKLVKPNQLKDSSTHEITTSQTKPQEQKVAAQHQLKAMDTSAPKKLTNKSSSEDTGERPKEIPKAHATTDDHVIKVTHTPQHSQEPEVKQDKKQEKDSQAKQENPASGKIGVLKEKIKKTNNLKFKVAQALLAHCETQNRLRQVFDEVNSSLKKAASLAKAIGSKFGIKQSDIDKMTSEHTEGAVQEFLNKLF